MHFRISCHFDMEPVAGFRTNKFNQLIRVMEYTRGGAEAAGQISTQGNHALDIVPPIFLQNGAQAFT